MLKTVFLTLGTPSGQTHGTYHGKNLLGRRKKSGRPFRRLKQKNGAAVGCGFMGVKSIV